MEGGSGGWCGSGGGSIKCGYTFSGNGVKCYVLLVVWWCGGDGDSGEESGEVGWCYVLGVLVW